jgi:hypothetical protein
METALANPQSGAVEVCVEGPKGPGEDANRKTSYLFIDGRFVLAVGRDKTTLPEHFSNRSRSTLEKELLNTRAQWTLGFHWFGLVYNRSDRQVHAYRINVNAPVTTQRKDFMRGDKVVGQQPSQASHPIQFAGNGPVAVINNEVYLLAKMTPEFIKEHKVWVSEDVLKAFNDNLESEQRLPNEVILALQTYRPNMLRPTNGLGDPGYLG